MKKKYIAPVIEAVNATTASILAGSPQTLESGGSNKDKGVNVAEGKATFFDDDSDIDWQ